MNTTREQAAGDGGPAFRFDQGDDWMRFSADLGQLCQDIGEQMRRTVAQIDVDAIFDEVRSAVDDVAAEAREAAENWRQSHPWRGPTRVRVDIRADAPAPTGQQPAQKSPAAERKVVLDLLAQGKISTEEAIRLLDALGG